MDFKHIPKKYRPIPFWSWNEKLDKKETKAQVKCMDEAGMGGFFMHARGGLQTEYMGAEWFENVTAAVETAAFCDMRPWAYDENGWPSGFGSGLVNGLGVEYQQKYLRMEKEPLHKETAICKCGEHYFYYEANPFYVDTLDKKVIAKFIEVAYQPYYEKYGTAIEGFFTDEPQISRKGIPWSFVFEEEYQSRYGENIREHLEQLFLPVNDYKRTRVKFWKMVTELFSETYMKQIYQWCDTRNLKLTGHLLLEENLLSQLETNGACMPHYEYMHIPGMDWLGRNICDCLNALQVSSVAEQLGKEAVLSETFAMCGHNVSFDELKGIYEWQMVRGVNLLCQHLEGYSIRGMRKRDYPPAMYFQQPWWEEYHHFVEAMSRIGMLLREGRHEVDVLVLHPQTTAWTMFDANKSEGIQELNQKLLRLVRRLEQNHIAFHFGDEMIMQRHGKVENGKLVIGKQRYSYVVDPGCELLLESTEVLLELFQTAGGMVITSEESLQILPKNNVIDREEITYTRRCFDSFDVHYFVNSSSDSIEAKVNVQGKRLDIYTGELQKFSGKHVFEPWGSLVLVEDKEKCSDSDCPEYEPEPVIIKPEGTFQIVSSTLNALTLDKCDYYLDGELQEKNGYVLNICERANSLERKVRIHQDYHVQAEYLPEKIYLVCETPEQFIISINGMKVEPLLTGHFVDKTLQKLDISKYMTLGKNVISFDCDFVQSEAVYENIRKARLFEGERNKLVYDMEIEAIYLLGDFSVRTEGIWVELERNAMRYQGNYVLDAPKREVNLQHLEMQGYPFFCGKMVLEGILNIPGEHTILQLERKGINVVKVEINGREKVLLTGNCVELDDFQVCGKTKVKLTIMNNLRNLLGPHHLEERESHSVRPRSFYKEPCVWNVGREIYWNEDYCFVETTL